MSEMFDRLLANKRIVVCVGSGGVGKTTTSAAFGVYAALAGKRTLVLTIDPAKRLANALGLEAFGNVATVVSLDALKGERNGPAQLSAMMLDMKQTFDDMVADYAKNAEEHARIRDNRLYQSMSQALAGIQEYMAVAKLYDVMRTGNYDMIVLDTPPTKNALDFLDAPKRFVDFLDQDALQWLLKQTSGAARGGFRLFDMGSNYVMKTLGRIAGLDVLKEIGIFVSAFYPLFLGFKDRADKISELLLSDDLGFVIVTGPTGAQVDEALYFLDKLHRQGLEPAGVVMNRTHQALPDTSLDATAAKWLSDTFGEPAAEVALRVGHDHNQLVALEQDQLLRLRERLKAQTHLLSSVELSEDVHSLQGLYKLGARLFV